MVPPGTGELQAAPSTSVREGSPMLPWLAGELWGSTARTDISPVRMGLNDN